MGRNDEEEFERVLQHCAVMDISHVLNVFAVTVILILFSEKVIFESVTSLEVTAYNWNTEFQISIIDYALHIAQSAFTLVVTRLRDIK